jgi:hypothetical protein
MTKKGCSNVLIFVRSNEPVSFGQASSFENYKMGDGCELATLIGSWRLAASR